jgi:predicted 2-oxoglutarate/Fe(II)-dependent dioxygenase YbiX
MKNAFLTDYIKVYRNFFGEEIGKDLIESTANDSERWKTHEWTSYEANDPKNVKSVSLQDDLSVTCDIPENMRNYLHLSIEEGTIQYLQDLNLGTGIISQYSQVRINRYLTGTKMAKHHDNIISLFESQSGSPILTYIGVLNNEYEGGEFLMFDNLQIKLNSGDLMIFPSAFMYTHEVLPVTSGERWSFVAWSF